MRVALHSVIRDGLVDGYVTAHQRIPDDLDASFRSVGIHDWVIWRSGDRLFHMVDCDDFDAAMAALEHVPANLRWQAVIGAYVELFRDADGGERMSPLHEVWSLRVQRGENAR